MKAYPWFILGHLMCAFFDLNISERGREKGKKLAYLIFFTVFFKSVIGVSLRC